MARLLIWAIVLGLGITAGFGARVATAKPTQAACNSCFEACAKYNRGPICRMHCQSRMGCKAPTGTTTKAQ
jgi:hypothetical protein